jgi:uncharacterized protein YbjT (DUF2867 family)
MVGRAVVTGAFSYTGAAVAAELLARGYRVHSLTQRRAPAGSPITTSPLSFAADHLRRELAGADVFVNTYWVRLAYQDQSFATAVERSTLLLDAAVAAGVKRVVQVSVSNAPAGGSLGYYRGKAEVEAHVRGLPVSHAIVRPTLVVGPNDVLTNNIAYLLRRFPVFPVPAARARLQPITLADAARIIVEAARDESIAEVDAAGPEVMTFMAYVRLVARACRVRRIVFPAPAWLALAGVRMVEAVLGDIVLTREELLGLEQELLLSQEPPRGTQSVAGWLSGRGEQLGRYYINDCVRHFGHGRDQLLLNPIQPSW